MKIPFNAIKIANTNLNMAFFVETGIGIQRLTFSKKSSYRVITTQSMFLVKVMNHADNSTVKVTE